MSSVLTTRHPCGAHIQIQAGDDVNVRAHIGTKKKRREAKIVKQHKHSHRRVGRGHHSKRSGRRATNKGRLALHSEVQGFFEHHRTQQWKLLPYQSERSEHPGRETHYCPMWERMCTLKVREPQESFHANNLVGNNCTPSHGRSATHAHTHLYVALLPHAERELRHALHDVV